MTQPPSKDRPIDTAITCDWSPSHGLCLRWQPFEGAKSGRLPVRLTVSGTHLFRVWGWQDSGEDAPRWAEPEFSPTLFGPATGDATGTCAVSEIYRDGALCGWRVDAQQARIAATLDLLLEGEGLTIDLAIRNPHRSGGQDLPLGAVELSIGGLRVGADDEYLSAHPYKGEMHGWGRSAELDAEGVAFHHGCVGLALPLVYLYDAASRVGLEFEFMLEDRPALWLRRPADDGSVTVSLSWGLERLLLNGQSNSFSGTWRITSYRGHAVARMREWRDGAAARYGLRSPSTPRWARRMNVIEFNTDPASNTFPFDRLDDPRVYDMLVEWKERGYTAIFTVGHNNTGSNFLSPFDYRPSAAAGGEVAERQYLAWAHELGFHAFLWVTTVGMERLAPEVAAHADWWTHRADGSLYYAWDSTAATGFVGYAPDADPLATGWREWLQDEVTHLLHRGFDGIYVDGCIPRASNHARWLWPGESRNGVPGQVEALARHIIASDDTHILFAEDEALYAQASAHVTQGRYHPMWPYLKHGAWEAMTGTGPEAFESLPRIRPEQVRDYLAVRYASRLPGVVSNDVLEGYYGEATRPWVVASLLAGFVPKTHSPYIDGDAWATWRKLHSMPEPPEHERARECREQGHAEFIRLLHLCRDQGDLVRESPLSMDAVEVSGDDAVIGLLRPTSDQCLLVLIQFADRESRVSIRLAEPSDVPHCERDRAGSPELTEWRIEEVDRSMVDTRLSVPHDRLEPGTALACTLAPYGFHVFHLRRCAPTP